MGQASRLPGGREASTERSHPAAVLPAILPSQANSLSILSSTGALIRLTKPVLSLWIAGVALTAWVVARQELSGTGIALTTLVLLLATGCATFNNVQDRDIDRLSPRTRRRPLPSGDIPLSLAIVQGATLITVSVLGLGLLTGGWTAPLLALVSAGLYNGLYTPLKRRTLLSIVPGAAAGAMPALLGWVAAGGDLRSPAPWALSALLVVWQLPHVWLLQLQQGDEPSCSHLPSMLHRLPVITLQRLTGLGITTFAALLLLTPRIGLVLSNAGTILLALLTTTLLATAAYLVTGRPDRRKHRALFHAWNLAMAAALVLIVVDRLLVT